MEVNPATLEHIKQVAELGLKHAKGNFFPVDRMSQCFEQIIKTVEATNGKQATSTT